MEEGQEDCKSEVVDKYKETMLSEHHRVAAHVNPQQLQQYA